MNGDNGTSTQAPQMRALLFTDLCDSLILVERIGDAAAAELFQEHDRLVLVLQQRWNGQLIDRSDGLFLLFERAIDALGFALDYQRGLQEIGKQRDIALRARAGLHVGEVLTWENSAEAVKVGAKSVEVEGLAKPMAARLMTLARPGQILLSAVAESLTHRASAELGERSGQLLWTSHGRWRFKGVPNSQEVFEVGEVGFAPLRMPRGNGKARRAIPFWRQPIALTAEVLLVAAIGVGLWAFMRPMPAIAFGERDWIVLGEMRNLTGNATLDDSMEQAFRISLEQSRYVNVLSDLKVNDTLQRMKRPEGTAVDRATAIEVALRDGARAVVLPSVMEVHGKLRVAVEVIDPASGNTVYSEYADGRGLESVLASTDQVVGQLRARLGEALQDVSRNSSPLPQVATANMDALHAYANGETAYGRTRYKDAMGYFQQASRFDPDFAFAYIGQLRVFVTHGDLDSARAMLTKASSLKSRMAARDALYLDAWDAELNGAGLEAAAEKWKLLGDLYPDYHGAHANYAAALFTLGDYAGAERAAAKAAVPQNPLQMLALQHVARAQLAQNRMKEAIVTFQRAGAIGQWKGNRQMAAAMAASGDMVSAQTMLDALPKNQAPAWLERTALRLDQGDVGGALLASDEALRVCGDSPMVCNIFQAQRVTVSALSVQGSEKVDYNQAIGSALQRIAAQNAEDRGEWLYHTLAMVYAAQRANAQAVVKHWMPTLEKVAADIQDPRASQLLQIVQAGQIRIAGNPERSVLMLEKLIDGHELFQAHVALRDSLSAAGRVEQASRQRQWLAGNRGLAYAEAAGSYTLQAMNVHDSRAARLDCAGQTCAN